MGLLDCPAHDHPTLPAQGHPNLSLVAEIAGLSERTLQRRLAQCGRTFYRIVEEVRFDIASDLLADPSRNIIDIAHAACYGNAPHFSRAFKRLTGMRPRDYRRSGRVPE
jgi:AraC-like DNA-binding protein